jgi:hypothetical protein
MKLETKLHILTVMTLAAVLHGCATQPTKRPVEVLAPIEVVTPADEDQPVITVQRTWRTPQYYSQVKLGAEYQAAIKLIQENANTDEFIAFVKSYHKKPLSHTDKTLEQALEIWRNQLDKGDLIRLKFVWNPLTKAYGGWTTPGMYIEQNTKFKMSPAGRAGHLLHETAHKYGWRHLGNYPNQNNNTSSFPYVIGYAFEDYLLEKAKLKIAGQP